MIKIFKKCMLLIFATFTFGSQAFAGNATSVNITNILPQDNGTGQVFIMISSPIPGVAGCGAGQSGRFVANPNTAGGKAIIAAAMSAYASNKTVSILGTGNCNLWGDTETAYYLVY